jgi:hypothetical protein
MDDRVFVEWYDEARPQWGGYVTTLDREFVKAFEEMVAEFGPPTLVEFRAAGTGWMK